jgi:hypothetical protein
LRRVALSFVVGPLVSLTLAAQQLSGRFTHGLAVVATKKLLAVSKAAEYDGSRLRSATRKGRLKQKTGRFS